MNESYISDRVFCNVELCSAEWEPSLGLCVAVGVVRSMVHSPATVFAGRSTAEKATASSVRHWFFLCARFQPSAGHSV